MAAIDDLMVAISSNPELRQAMTGAANPEDAVKVAADAGYKVTSQELLEAYQSKMTDLSEDELSSISGGKGRYTGGRGVTGGDPIYSKDRGNKGLT